MLFIGTFDKMFWIKKQKQKMVLGRNHTIPANENIDEKVTTVCPACCI